MITLGITSNIIRGQFWLYDTIENVIHQEWNFFFGFALHAVVQHYITWQIEGFQNNIEFPDICSTGATPFDTKRQLNVKIFKNITPAKQFPITLNEHQASHNVTTTINRKNLKFKRYRKIIWFPSSSSTSLIDMCVVEPRQSISGLGDISRRYLCRCRSRSHYFDLRNLEK